MFKPVLMLCPVFLAMEITLFQRAPARIIYNLSHFLWLIAEQYTRNRKQKNAFVIRYQVYCRTFVVCLYTVRLDLIFF